MVTLSFQIEVVGPIGADAVRRLHLHEVQTGVCHSGLATESAAAAAASIDQASSGAKSAAGMLMQSITSMSDITPEYMVHAPKQQHIGSQRVHVDGS